MYFAQATFNAVYKKNDKGKIVQMMDDLKDEDGNSLCWKDIEAIKPILERYGIGNKSEPENLYILNEAHAFAPVKKVIVEIRRRIRDNPDTNFLIVYVLAGHGM